MTDANRTLLILDLDETLMFASERPLSHAPDHLVGPYFVYRRPYLQEFLADVAQYFDLAVWSSSSIDYAQAVSHSIFPSHLNLKFVWGRDRCIQRYDSEMQSIYYVKDLKKVERHGFDRDRILIVDDTPQKCEQNYGNAVYVSAFFGDRSDAELQRLTRYLQSLASLTNVRNVEKRNWKTNH